MYFTTYKKDESFPKGHTEAKLMGQSWNNLSNKIHHFAFVSVLNNILLDYNQSTK